MESYQYEIICMYFNLLVIFMGFFSRYQILITFPGLYIGLYIPLLPGREIEFDINLI